MTDVRNLSTHHILAQKRNLIRPNSKPQEKQSFRDVFHQELNQTAGLKVSKHAAERMEQRKITLEPSEWRDIARKVDEAKTKGVNEPLVITDQLAMVISAKNKTVITAMATADAKAHLFNHIDGAILMK